ncbi:hypothetical protein CEXT_25321 [Caerostris extrusa]|uniref:Uncharacterized protein n=1 Tax=Caerostris extrusa TaxID=172846 RepID=A0AAV4T5B9_CAEEX|nr:hypothetical protein CEXT_25321 [Caerostris extrusa]
MANCLSIPSTLSANMIISSEQPSTSPFTSQIRAADFSHRRYLGLGLPSVTGSNFFMLSIVFCVVPTTDFQSTTGHLCPDFPTGWLRTRVFPSSPRHHHPYHHVVLHPCHGGNGNKVMQEVGSIPTYLSACPFYADPKGKARKLGFRYVCAESRNGKSSKKCHRGRQ